MKVYHTSFGTAIKSKTPGIDMGKVDEFTGRMENQLFEWDL